MATCKIIEFPAPEPKITTVADLLTVIEVRCSNWMIVPRIAWHVMRLRLAVGNLPASMGPADRMSIGQLLAWTKDDLKAIAYSVGPEMRREQRRALDLLQRHARAYGFESLPPSAMPARQPRRNMSHRNDLIVLNVRADGKSKQSRKGRA